MSNLYDVIIIGAGPSGMSAALYLSRSKYKFLIIEKEMIGGKLNITTKIENYPGVGPIDGYTLASNIKKQLNEKNVHITNDEILDISQSEDNTFVLIGKKDKYLAKYIIIGTGYGNKKIGKEDPYIGKGISYCATCDGFFYKNKDVAVFANERNGYLEALHLTNFVKNLYLINDNNKDDNEENLLKLKSIDNVTFLNPYKIVDYIGNGKIEGIIIFNLNNEETKLLNVDGVFPFIGETPTNYFLKKLNLNTNNDFIIVDKYNETSIKGIYAIGDIVDKPLKQIVTACSDGANAATSCISNLNKENKH